MKRIFVAFSGLVLCICSMAQRYSPERSYDVIGLAGGDEISDCLTKGLPFLLIGLLILFACIKDVKKAEKEKKEAKESWFGCLGLVLIGISVIIMLPLLAWIEAIVVSIIGILFFVAIIFLIYNWITK